MELSTEIMSVGAAGILCLGALILMSVRSLEKANKSYLLALAAVVLALVFQLCMVKAPELGSAFRGAIAFDTLSTFITSLILCAALLVLAMSQRALEMQQVRAPLEYYALFLFSAAGAIVLASSRELLTLFLALEVMSMSLYCMCGMSEGESRSAESAMKYFFSGSFSSAFLLFGICLVYGMTGSTVIPVASHLLSANLISFFAIGLLLIGLGFKVSAVPFHFWAPDVYEGAPTPTTAYMGSVVKIAAFTALMRVMWGLFGDEALFERLSAVVWVMALLSMIVGNFLALRQQSIKRMLAYSGIAHIGYLLIAILTPEVGGKAAALFYLATYAAITLGAFAIVIAVSRRYGSDSLNQFSGLGAKSPVLAVAMSVFMFALAGLPPGMAGLFGKFYLFQSAIAGGFYGLAICGILSSAVSCYYYLRVVVVMLFSEATESQQLSKGVGQVADLRNPQVAPISAFAYAAVLACLLLTVGLGIFPGSLYAYVMLAAGSL